MRKKDSPRFSLPASRAALKACKDYTASPSKEKTHSCLYGIGTHLTIGHILLLLCIFTTDTKIAGPSIMSPMPVGTRHRPIESISSDPASPVLDKIRGSRQTDGARTEHEKGLGCASRGHIEQSQDGPACPAGGCSHSALWPSCRSMSFRPAQSPIFCISSDSSLSRDCIHSCLAGIHLFIFAISHHFLTLSETCKNAVRTFVLVSCYASRILLVQAEKGGKHPWARTRYTILSSRR